jgi:hypothetical protein
MSRRGSQRLEGHALYRLPAMALPVPEGTLTHASADATQLACHSRGGVRPSRSRSLTRRGGRTSDRPRQRRRAARRRDDQAA